MRKILLIILMIPAFACCGSKTAEKDTETSSSYYIPEDAVPFEVDGHIYLNALLNGKDSCRLLFDTGADMLYLDKDFCRLDSVDLAGRMKIKASLGGVGEGAQLVDLVTDTVTVSAVNLEERFGRTVILGLRDIVGCGADGIVGMDNFMDKPLEINFEHSYMRNLDTVRHEMLQGYTGLPVRIDEAGRVYLDLEVRFPGKQVAGSFILDLGSRSGISIAGGCAEENALDELDVDRKTGHFLNGGIGGGSSRVCITSEAVIIGQDTLKGVEVSYSLDKKGALGMQTEYAGLAGIEIFSSRYNIILDFEGKVLYLSPFQVEKKVEGVDRGFRTVDRTDIGAGWIVNYMEDNSPAFRAGLVLGDTIMAVNGSPVDNNSYKTLMPLLDTASVIDLEIRGKSGKLRKVSL